MSPPTNVSVARGLTAEFSCTFNRPVMVVEWLRDGTQLPTTARQTISKMGNTAILTISNVTYIDGGIYSCQVLTIQSSARLSLIPRKHLTMIKDTLGPWM